MGVLSYTGTHTCFVIAFSFGKEPPQKVEILASFKKNHRNQIYQMRNR